MLRKHGCGNWKRNSGGGAATDRSRGRDGDVRRAAGKDFEKTLDRNPGLVQSRCHLLLATTRRSRESGNPEGLCSRGLWIPAKAGMTY